MGKQPIVEKPRNIRITKAVLTKRGIWAWIQRLLAMWGAICLVAIVTIAIAIQFSEERREQRDSFSKRDVAFVLNWAQLGTVRIESVLHGYKSPVSFNGDHFTLYAIKLSQISTEELENKLRSKFSGWQRGDQLTETLSQTLKWMDGWTSQEGGSWYPHPFELRNSGSYLLPWQMEFHEGMPSALDLIIVRPKERMLFYFSGQT